MTTMSAGPSVDGTFTGLYRCPGRLYRRDQGSLYSSALLSWRRTSQFTVFRGFLLRPRAWPFRALGQARGFAMPRRRCHQNNLVWISCVDSGSVESVACLASSRACRPRYRSAPRAHYGLCRCDGRTSPQGPASGLRSAHCPLDASVFLLGGDGKPPTNHFFIRP